MKKEKGIYDKRIELIKSEKQNPTKEELQDAYGYLDYCLSCGGKITFFDHLIFNFQHGTLGNTHKWRCKNKKTKNKEDEKLR